MSSVLLLRHGAIVRDSPIHRFLGQSDPPLSDLGKKQMERLARNSLLDSVEKVWCSPLQRCTDGAAIVAAERQHCKIETVPELTEISLGKWEGLTVAEVRRNFPGAYEARGRELATYRPPGGESFADLLLRVWPVFEQAARSRRRIALMSHAGVNRVLLCKILGMPLAHLFRLGQDYGNCSVISVEEDHFRVSTLNILSPQY
jgi:broad specificity phosphatase PhoE